VNLSLLIPTIRGSSTANFSRCETLQDSALFVNRPIYSTLFLCKSPTTTKEYPPPRPSLSSPGSPLLFLRPFSPCERPFFTREDRRGHTPCFGDFLFLLPFFSSFPSSRGNALNGRSWCVLSLLPSADFFFFLLRLSHGKGSAHWFSLYVD